MVPSTTADTYSNGRAPHVAGRDHPIAPPNGRLRMLLAGILGLVVVASIVRDPQYALVTPIPLILIWLTPRGASRVLLFFVGVLVAMGGLVTTYREGMVFEQWPKTLDRGMLEYPLSEMLAGTWGGILEHSHRLLGAAVGMVAIAVVMTTFIYGSAKSLKVMAFATLAAISIQGIIGGTRVLENSQNLAFLHGTIAQAVVAMIAVLCVMASHSWRDAQRTESEFAKGAWLLGPWVVGLMYVQYGLGAWLRHHGQTVALMLHGTYALFVVVMVLVFAKQLGVAATEGKERGTPRRPLDVLQWVLLGAVSLQFLLGLLATFGIYLISGGMQAEVSVAEAVFATGHVVVGAVLFSSTVCGAVFARRMLARPSA